MFTHFRAHTNTMRLYCTAHVHVRYKVCYTSDTDVPMRLLLAPFADD